MEGLGSKAAAAAHLQHDAPLDAVLEYPALRVPVVAARARLAGHVHLTRGGATRVATAAASTETQGEARGQAGLGASMGAHEYAGKRAWGQAWARTWRAATYTRLRTMLPPGPHLGRALASATKQTRPGRVPVLHAPNPARSLASSTTM